METTPIPPTRMGMEVVEPPTTHRVSWPWTHYPPPQSLNTLLMSSPGLDSKP